MNLLQPTARCSSALFPTFTIKQQPQKALLYITEANKILAIIVLFFVLSKVQQWKMYTNFILFRYYPSQKDVLLGIPL